MVENLRSERGGLHLGCSSQKVPGQSEVEGPCRDAFVEQFAQALPYGGRLLVFGQFVRTDIVAGCLLQLLDQVVQLVRFSFSFLRFWVTEFFQNELAGVYDLGLVRLQREAM